MALKLQQRGTANPSRESLSFISDYNDFLPGNSWKKLFYGDEHTVTTTKKLLFPEAWAVNAGNSYTQTVITTTTFTKEIDLDFDITIKGDRLIGGDCLAQAKFGIDVGTGKTVTAYPIVKVIHYNGSTETILATMQGTEQAQTSTIQANYVQTLKGTITSKHFKIGDILRITVELWAKENDAGHTDNGVYLYYDGGNADGTGSSLIHIPFVRLDEY